VSEQNHPAPPLRPWHPPPVHFLVVGLGGLLGANARYYVGEWVATRWGTAFPWGTLLINVSGSFALGLFLALATERGRDRPALRLFVATGFLGGYTTFSAFGYETIRLLQDGHLGRAALYVGASLVAGIVAVVAGMAFARVVAALTSRSRLLRRS
jgi:fluoride exporter